VGGRDIASLLATDGNLILSYLMGGHRVDLDSQRALDRVRIVDVDRGLGLQPKSPVTCEPEGLLEEIKMLLGRLRERSRRERSLYVNVYRKVV